MAITTTIDRFGIRWIKFNSVFSLLTKVISNSARDLRHVSAKNICDYGQLKLEFKCSIKSENCKSKYINDVGLLEYFNFKRNKEDVIKSILKELGLSLQLTVNEDIVLYRDSFLFEDQKIYFANTFCVIRIQYGILWIEAVKLCRLFNYSDPWNSLCKHVTDDNKATAEDLLQLDNSTNGEVCVLLHGICWVIFCQLHYL